MGEQGPATLPRSMDEYGWLDVPALSWAMRCEAGETLRCLLQDQGRFALAIRQTPTCPKGHFYTRAKERISLDVLPDNMPLNQGQVQVDNAGDADGRTRRNRRPTIGRRHR